jgi:hypothetical protein
MAFKRNRLLTCGRRRGLHLRWAVQLVLALVGGLFCSRTEALGAATIDACHNAVSSIDANRTQRQALAAWYAPARASSLPLQRAGGAADALDDTVEIGEDVLILEPKDVPAKPCERRIARGIGPRAPFVVAAIELDDEADLRASEVDDVVARDEFGGRRAAIVGERPQRGRALARARPLLRAPLT